MDSICKDIFKAIHEGKCLSIEYKNKDDKITKYWIGIKNIDLRYNSLIAEGLHLSKYTLCELKIYIDSILSSHVIDGSYFETNENLLNDIRLNPHKYRALFHNVANLKILNYLYDCNRLDTTPYKCEYSLLTHFDGANLTADSYQLSDEQFRQIVAKFQSQSQSHVTNRSIKQLCLNIMSINTKHGLYVLAYRHLNLDVKAKALKLSDNITICREFTVNGEKKSISQFLDLEDYALLDEFSKNQEEIKDRVTQHNRHIRGVDDMPYLIAIGRDIILDLNHEYSAILDMYNKDEITIPIKAFFGDLTKRPERRKEHPLALLNKRVNLDQLLAINKSIKYPLAYIQGPPGTGKTNTIINTVSTAFFNGKTVLLVAYNNHPIDGVFNTLQSIIHKGNRVPFPVIRLGNNDKILEALKFVKSIYEQTEKITVYESTLDRNRDDKIEKAKQLTALLQKHEDTLDLEERRDTIEKLLHSNNHLRFQAELQARQLHQVGKRLSEIGQITDEDALALLSDDEAEFIKYLYYVSAKYIKRLGEKKNRDLLDIVYLHEPEEQVKQFNKYVRQDTNLKKLLQIFPIVITTCISSHKLGDPKPNFDMVIMDEASQCNSAIALVSIIRGESLMLVGDPQQLNPVVLLDPKDNLTLRQRYAVSSEYDYVSNSIYKTYLACDSVSDEILLSYHYRCHERIIGFNNKKYYNNKLKIKSNSEFNQPLVFIDIPENNTDYKNTSPSEADEIIRYVKKSKDKSIGVITPFANQREYINVALKENAVQNVTCGTVHAFQGDEKDIILFSLALTDQTRQSTYDWLKNNKELINVATSRAKEQLVLLSSSKHLARLHNSEASDDLFELVEYIKTNGIAPVTRRAVASRALGVKPYSTETEEAFLTNLNHALDNILYSNAKCIVRKEVGISHVFSENNPYNDLFYTGRFDFVVYEKSGGGRELPVLAIELDGKEHIVDDAVRERDRKKNEICRSHGFELIRIENSYARRYHYIKDILHNYFTKIK